MSRLGDKDLDRLGHVGRQGQAEPPIEGLDGRQDNLELVNVDGGQRLDLGRHGGHLTGGNRVENTDGVTELAHQPVLRRRCQSDRVNARIT
jgi:hypothetical protein